MSIKSRNTTHTDSGFPPEDVAVMSEISNDKTLISSGNISTAKPKLNSISSSLSGNKISDSATNQISTTNKPELSTTTPKMSLQASVENSTSTILPSSDSDPLKLSCNKKEANFSGYNWALETIEANASLEIECPQGLSGSATWPCLPSGKWLDMPDLSECSRQNLTNLLEEQENGTTAAEILTRAADKLSKRTLFAGDVFKTGELLNKLITKHEDDLTNAINQDDGQKLAREFLEAAVNATEQTLKNSTVWKYLLEDKRVSTSTEIQEGLYDATIKYTNYLHNETDITHENIAIRASRQPTICFNHPEKKIFKSPYDDYTSITLPNKFYEGYENQNSTVKVIFMVYQNLGCINNPIPCSHPETTKLQDYVSAKSQINSAIIGAKVGDAPTWNATDGENVVVYLKHIYNGENYELGEGTCVWWNTYSNNWDSQGCTVNVTNDDYTVCHCNHLTNFAVIMDINGILQRDTGWYKQMQLITIIGSCVSIFSLSLCILFFAGFSKTPQGKRLDHNFSRMNLCICLLLAKSVSLVGLDRTDNTFLCVAVAVSLHYLFQATFTWSAIEAFQLYKNFIVIFKKDGSRKKTFLAVGYLGPMLVVAMTLIFSKLLNSNIYGTSTACWLSQKNIWIFAGMILPILLVNTVMFVLVMRRAWGKKTQSSKSTDSRLGGSISIFLFLCLTWIPGFFYFAEGSKPVAVLFTVLNSFDGIPMFIASILLDESIMGRGKIVKKKRNECCHKAQLVRHSHLNSNQILNNTDIKRRNHHITREHRTNVKNGERFSSGGSLTPFSEETYYENGSSTYDSRENCSSTTNISSTSCLENHVVTASGQSGKNSLRNSFDSTSGLRSLCSERGTERDCNIYEIIISSPYTFCEEKAETLGAGSLSYLTPKYIHNNVSLAEPCVINKAQYRNNWNDLKILIKIVGEKQDW